MYIWAFQPPQCIEEVSTKVGEHQRLRLTACYMPTHRLCHYE